MATIINKLNHLSTFVSHRSHPRSGFLRSTFRPLPFGLLLTSSLLIFNSCGLDVEDPTPPSPPVWVQKSLPEEWPERGIDAHESGGIFLEWEPNPDEDILAYNIYRATWYELNDSLGIYNLLTRLETKSIAGMKYIDTKANTRTTYYYKIKAEESSENLSDYSDSLFFTTLPQISPGLMTPNGQTNSLDQDRNLSWHCYLTVEVEDYCLTIMNKSNRLVLRVNIPPNNYAGGNEFWIIPNDIVLETGEVYQWRVDTGAMYFDGRETVGSESVWAMFLYTGS